MIPYPGEIEKTTSLEKLIEIGRKMNIIVGRNFEKKYYISLKSTGKEHNVAIFENKEMLVNTIRILCYVHRFCKKQMIEEFLNTDIEDSLRKIKNKMINCMLDAHQKNIVLIK